MEGGRDGGRERWREKGRSKGEEEEKQGKLKTSPWPKLQHCNTLCDVSHQCA